MAPFTGGRFYALGTNIAHFDPYPSLVLFDHDGLVVRSWQIGLGLGYSRMVTTDDTLFINGIGLLILDQVGRFKHLIYGLPTLTDLSAFEKDAEGQLWLGVFQHDTIESGIFRINAEGEVGPSYALRPQFTYGMPEHSGWVSDMAPLPGGGWVLAGFMRYFDPDNPWEKRWKYFSWLAEIGADGAVRWGQLHRDMDIIGIQRNSDGHLWAYGYLERTSNILEKAVVMRFSPQGEPEWGVERAEGIYDWVLSDTLASAPGGGLAMGWTQEGHQELWFGILKPSKIQEGCEAILPAEISDRWLGPVEIDVRPIAIEPVEMPPVEIWEEPVELWEGEGQAGERCILENTPLRKAPGLP